MFEFTILIGILLIGVYLIRQSEKKDPRKIFDVYCQPGKWYYLKYVTIFILFFLRRLKYYFNKEAFDEKIKEKDTLQNLSDHKLVRQN